MAKKTAEKPYDLVIVESPAKAKTIERFLGEGYRVTASNGHIRDLPKSKIGVDIENDFEPSYIVIRGRSPIIKELKEQASKARMVYLATDPDREGEAISWHIAYLLGIDNKSTCRIEFNEITKSAVEHAIQNPRRIDIDRVNAQQARRVLDRLVGYKLSPLLWKKVRRGLSAGRVQSVAVKLIVDRENEIRAFVPKEFWTITALLSAAEGSFEAKYFGKNGKKFVPENEAEANEILDAVKGAPFVIKSVKKGVKRRSPQPPYTTSTLQQDASRKLGFTTKKTMMLAQILYEGVKLSETETAGLITYTRTDSTRVSTEAQAAAREFILQHHGADYAPTKPNVYAGRKNAQDAHEAIRPSYMDKAPDKLKGILPADQLKLYTLIYRRFMASQMTPAIYDTLAYDIDANGQTFRAAGERMVFKGYRAVYQEQSDDEEQTPDEQNLPLCPEGEKLSAKKLTPKQNFTQPPQRFTEATLVKVLEEKGIGRPSTYAPINSTIQDRGYIVKQQRSLMPTELGEAVTKIMCDNFPDIVDEKFTADMEDKLDNVEHESNEWKGVIRKFYGPFEKELDAAETNIERVKLPERPAGIICEKCGAEMVYKQGRFGEFIACPNYPECKNTKPIKKTINTPCPLCGGEVVIKKTGKGKTFYGCANYPECTFTSWDMPIEEKCPTCGSFMVMKRYHDKQYKKCGNAECPTNQRKTEKAEAEGAETESVKTVKKTAAKSTAKSAAKTTKKTTTTAAAKKTTAAKAPKKTAAAKAEKPATKTARTTAKKTATKKAEPERSTDD